MAPPRAASTCCAKLAKICMRSSRSSIGISELIPVITGKWKSPFSGRSRITPCTSISARSLPSRKNAIGVRSVISTLSYWAKRAARWPAPPKARFRSAAAARSEECAGRYARGPREKSPARSRASHNDFAIPGFAPDGSAPFPAKPAKNAPPCTPRPRQPAATAVPNITRRYVFQAFLPNFRRLISRGFCRRRYFGSSSARTSWG